MLSIYVPTRGRIAKQLTMKHYHLETIHQSGKHAVYFVVPRSEAKEFKRYYKWARVLIVSDDFKAGSINQRIADHCLSLPKKVIVDDDFTLARRRDPLSTNQRNSSVHEATEVFDLFRRIETWFKKGYVHGGVSMRNANQFVGGQSYQTNGRVCGFMFFDAEILRRENVRFDAVEEHQAFHVTLALLELGYENVIDYEFMFGHHGTNAAGGCSCYRTVAYLEEQAQQLERLHPTVRKFYRKLANPAAASISSPEGIPAVKVQWKKAFGMRIADRHIPRSELERRNICCI